jgi:hypothetical protein
MASTSNQETFKAEGLSGRVVYDVLRQVTPPPWITLTVAGSRLLMYYVRGGSSTTGLKQRQCFHRCSASHYVLGLLLCCRC